MEAVMGKPERGVRLVVAGVFSLILITGVISGRFAPSATALPAPSLNAASIVASLGPPAGAVQGRSEPLARAHVSVASCLFNGGSDQTPVPNVTPGSSISISCTGFAPSETVFADEGSPLYLDT